MNPLAVIGRIFLSFLAAIGDLTLFAGARDRAGPERAVLPARHPAPDGRHRLLLAAGGRADRDLHRHGAGAAELYRLLALRGRERGRHDRGAVDDARARPGAGRADGRRPGRRLDGGRDRHHARDRADRRADHAVDRPVQVPGLAAPDRRPADAAAAGDRRRHHRRVRRLHRRHLQARLQSRTSISATPSSSWRPRTWSRAWSRRRCSASWSR